MSDESKRFRARARECRAIAAVSEDAHMRELLIQTAAELEEEAAKIEAEEGGAAGR